MTHISPKQPDCKVNERLAELLSAHAVHLEALARLLCRPFRASRRLSARFDFRLVPSQPDEKSCRQASHRSWRQFPASPPSRSSRFLLVHYRPQRPQQPEDSCHQFHPSLFAAFRRQAIELSAHQTDFLLPEPDGMLNTEAFVVNRLGLARRRRLGRPSFSRPSLTRDEQQPERTPIASFAVCAVLDHLIERQWLRGPTLLSHIEPTSNFDPPARGQLPAFHTVGARMRLRIVELEFRAELRRTPRTAVLLDRQIKTAIVTHTPKDIDAFGHNRLEKRPHCVLRIHIKHVVCGPVMRLDKGFDLLGAETGRAMFGRHPGDLQRERPGTFTNTFGEHRQPDARLHPVSAVDIADAHRFHLRAVMISRIENANLPRAEVFSQWRRWMIGQPRQTFFPQLKQPVFRISILAERVDCAAQRLIQAIVAVGEERGIGDFDRRFWSRADRESVNNIEQYRATGDETGGDGGAKI